MVLASPGVSGSVRPVGLFGGRRVPWTSVHADGCDKNAGESACLSRRPSSTYLQKEQDYAQHSALD